jgi:hypothetical protein
MYKPVKIMVFKELYDNLRELIAEMNKVNYVFYDEKNGIFCGGEMIFGNFNRMGGITFPYN